MDRLIEADSGQQACQPFLVSLKEIGITDEDEYSEDPERRRLFWLNNAAITLDNFLRNVEGKLTLFPKNCETVLQTRRTESGDLINLSVILDAVTLHYREGAIRIIEELENITNEKGFRFQPSLFTSREHKNIGSSGYGGIYWDTDPDVPIYLLNTRLIPEGKINPEEGKENLTFEEIDRARRLMGMTRLDPETERVTDQIDEEASKDSYFFLTPERRAEIIDREQKLLSEVRTIVEAAISEHTMGIITLFHYLLAYVDGKLTSPELQIRYKKVLEQTTSRYPLTLDTCIREIKKCALEAGKWDYILTPQEILLRIGGQVDKQYLAHPYTPLIIQDGGSIEETDRLRQGEYSMIVNTKILEYEMPFGFRLEKLDKNGITLKSPIFLDHNDGVTDIEKIAKSLYKGKINVPFARPEDWFYKPENPNHHFNIYGSGESSLDLINGDLPTGTSHKEEYDD